MPKNMNVVFIIIILVTGIIQSTQLTDHWSYSAKLNEWYSELDLCLLRNGSTIDIKAIMEGCEKKLQTESAQNFLPMRCRAGNSWPSKGAFCSSEDIPYTQRHNLRKSFLGFDEPAEQPLRTLFSSLSTERGALLLVGDSVMQQFYSAIACELERENIWTDSSHFKNTNSPQFVKIGKNLEDKEAFSVPIQFAPIYHFVNGRHDRVVSLSIKFILYSYSLIQTYDTKLNRISNFIARSASSYSASYHLLHLADRNILPFVAGQCINV